MSTGTSRPEKAARRLRPSGRGRRVALGIVLVAAALVMLSIGLVRMASSDGGFPWTTSYGGPVDGPIVVTIDHEDGRVETYELPTSEEAEAFVERRHVELKDEYGLAGRAQQGRMIVVGAGLVALAAVVVIVRRPRPAASH